MTCFCLKKNHPALCNSQHLYRIFWSYLYFFDQFPCPIAKSKKISRIILLVTHILIPWRKLKNAFTLQKVGYFSMSLSLLSSRESKCSCERQLPRPSAAFRKQPRLTAPASGPTGKATQIVWPDHFLKLLNSYSEKVIKIVEKFKIN